MNTSSLRGVATVPLQECSFSPGAELSPRAELALAIDRLAQGDGRYRFILLRESPLDERLINQGDADLIGSPGSVQAMLQFLLPMAAAGRIHFRVTRQRPGKLQLTLYSRDLGNHAIFDLWMDLPQIDQGRRLLGYSDLEPAASWKQGAVGRLEGCVEGALYLQHLVSKKKPLDAPHTSRRLQTLAAHTCAHESCRLAAFAWDALQTGAVSDDARKQSRQLLQERLNVDFAAPRHLAPRQHRRKPVRRAVCVMGVDGVGKSSLIESLTAASSGTVTHVTGKRFYRRSWIYQLLTRRLRRASDSGRESFDERWCVPLALRAAWSFALRLAIFGRSSRLMMVDRSLTDFLYLGRKRDDGGFHPWATGVAKFGVPVPTLHLVAEHSVTSARKAEMTEQGHARYDRDVLEALTRRTPCDHFVMYNGGSRAESAATAARYLKDVVGFSAIPGPAVSVPTTPAGSSSLRSA